jgi:mannose-6-phosphate isomerase
MGRVREQAHSGIAESAENVAHDTRAIRAITSGIRVLDFTDTKVVIKPWGRERWLHESDAPYGFKVIRITAGSRTSLQYHRYKRESYFILEGEAILHYRDEQDGSTLTLLMPAGTLAHVDPGSVHRVEAVTDIVLVEVCTPDDGSDNVRLSDDYRRGDGRVESEH